MIEPKKVYSIFLSFYKDGKKRLQTDSEFELIKAILYGSDYAFDGCWNHNPGQYIEIGFFQDEDQAIEAETKIKAYFRANGVVIR